MTTESPTTFDDFLPLITRPTKLFNGLNAIWRSWYLAGKKRRPNSDKIIRKLHNEGHCNILSIATVAFNEGESAFDIMKLLNPVMDSLLLKPVEIVSFWELIFEKTKTDMMSGTQFEYLAKFLKNNPKIGDEVFNLLKRTKAPFTVSYMSGIKMLLSKRDFQAQFNELMKMTKSKNEYQVRAAVHSLGRLKYSGKKRTHISQVLKRYSELEKKASGDVLFTLIHAYGALLLQRKTVYKNLVSSLSYDNSEVDYALSEILFRNKGKWENEIWYKEIFLRLSRTSVKHRGTIDNLDYIADSYMKTPTGVSIVEEFLFSWLENSDYSPKDIRFETLFDSVTFGYLKSRDNLERFITELFNSDHGFAHSLASQFVSSNSLHKFPPVKFCRSTLKKLQLEDLIFISRKVISHVYQRNEVASLIYSLLNKGATNEKIQSLVFEIFTDIIGPDYLDSTIAFLKVEEKKTRAVCRKNLCKKAIANLEQKIAEFEALPRLKECYASQNKRYIANLGHQKVMRRSMEEANEGSLVNMFTKVSLKYGRGSFFVVDRKISNATPMSTHSTSIELPRSEVHHPVYGAIQRMSYRMAKRGET